MLHVLGEPEVWAPLAEAVDADEDVQKRMPVDLRESDKLRHAERRSVGLPTVFKDRLVWRPILTPSWVGTRDDRSPNTLCVADR